MLLSRHILRKKTVPGFLNTAICITQVILKESSKNLLRDKLSYILRKLSMKSMFIVTTIKIM